MLAEAALRKGSGVALAHRFNCASRVRDGGGRVTPDAADPAAVRAVVAEVLGTSPGAVEPGVNLISQGFDSIRMMTLAGRWRQQGFAVEFADLAADPTIEAWSALLAAAAPVAA